ncbi:response regulator transcription factor [Actinomadura sp. 9N215]|uniref:response regulator transcription factor n=1 Tax=Actinomadura sp. 9N215 TaxID=3375150 RepID=UPI003793AD69
MSEAADPGASAADLGEALSRAIAPLVAHDAVKLLGTSPNAGSALWSFGFWHAYDPDFCRPRPRTGTGPGNGTGSEMRLLLRDARGRWGQLGLVRAERGRPFDETDVKRAAQLAPTLIAFLRAYVTAGPLAPSVPPPPPGVFVIGPDEAVRTATPQAYQWRQQLEDHASAPRFTSDASTTGLAAQTRRHARDPNADPPLIVGPSAVYGRWVAAHGQVLDGTDDVAVIIQAASTQQLLPAFCGWYGISARERQIIAQLREARAPKQIARCLDLSVHTVNDHLKAVFRKTGASGRDELLAAFTA